jgi:hypothetical protein
MTTESTAPHALRARLLALIEVLGGPVLRTALPVTAGLWLLLAALWLAQVLGHGAPVGLARIIAVIALLALQVTLAGLFARLLQSRSQPWGLALLVLLQLGWIVGTLGLGFEVGRGYYTDEGHYLHHARRVNSGELFVRTMIYPHVLYHVDAFALWLSGLFPGLAERFTLAAAGPDLAPGAADWMVLRIVGALFGVLTLVPVFFAARHLGGNLAAVLAAGAQIFARHFHEGYQVNTCDVPSAAFAALALYWIARLVDEENPRLYLAAGISAGLAGATKYPAGVVVVGIVGVWVVHRLRERNFRLGLLWAGLASLATFLAVNPSLFVFPQETLFGTRGIFFGVRQYSQGGWIGVMPSSNTLFFLDKLLLDFRWPLVLLAVLGTWGLAREPRGRSILRRLAVFAIYPVAYFFLITSMNMVVVRNLFPLVPALAVVLGVLAAGSASLFDGFPTNPCARRTLPALLVVVALLWPAFTTGRQALALSRPGTRDLMSRWIAQHLPRGAGILKESYTPNFSPVEHPTLEQRFALRLPEASFSNPAFDYLLLADHAHGRFFRPEHQTPTQAAWYEETMAHHPLVHEVAPGPWRIGPRLTLHRLRQELEPQRRVTLRAAEAFLPNPRLLEGDAIHFSHPAQFALFKVSLAAGPLRLSTRPAFDGEARLLTGDDQELARLEVLGGTARGTVPDTEKLFVYLYPAEPPATLAGLTLDITDGKAPTEPAPGETP